MGWFGFGKKEEDERLNTKDLTKGATMLLDRDGDGKITAKDFEGIFEARAKAMGLLASNEHAKQVLDSDAYKAVEKGAGSLLDADGDGKVTPKDFELLFNRGMVGLNANAATIDPYLPMMGQIAFGLGVGYSLGRVARGFAKSKIIILLAGTGGYFGAQYYAQMGYMEQLALQKTFETQMTKVADVNGDGKLDRKDIDALIESKMKIINQKLGPGGFAPGAMGTGTFALGLLKGLRVF
eukprot:PhM_4_TR7048/c0_g1_i1/m.31598